MVCVEILPVVNGERGGGGETNAVEVWGFWGLVSGVLEVEGGGGEGGEGVLVLLSAVGCILSEF